MKMEAPPSQPSYLTTVATQILMCFGLYISLNLGDASHHLTANNRPFYYFITVNGGSRPPLHQTLLLQQMEKVIRSYDTQFVLAISELGQEDPLLQNGTRKFPCLRIPWYATKVSNENKSGRLSKQFLLPAGRSLEIIVLDIDMSKDDALDTSINSPIEQLRRTLKATENDWRYVVGLKPLEGCNESNDPTAVQQIHKRLHGMFSRYQVNAYLSRHGCEDYAERGGVAYMSQPGPTPTGKGCYGSPREASDGFFLHKVGLLEIETYRVNVDGKVVRKTSLHQRGHEAI